MGKLLVGNKEAAARLKARLRYAVYIMVKAQKYDINNITVSLLAEQAKISRATFYNYYDSIGEFSKEILDYLVDVVIKQSIRFLSGGRENLKKNCKTDNLIISREDRLLISILEPYVCFEMFERGFPAAYKGFIDSSDELPFDMDFMLNNKDAISFFMFGFFKVVFKAFTGDPDGKKLYKIVSYSFDLWDDLFPDNKT